MRSLSRDTLIVLYSTLAIVAIIVIISIFSPSNDDSDSTPTSYNSGTNGAKAAYLLLQEFGYDVRRWDHATAALDEVDAAHTTLILAEPELSSEDMNRAKQAVEDFLRRGGRVLVTGASGARYLPQSDISQATRLNKDLCSTIPEGRGALARAGTVTISGDYAWTSHKTDFRVQQRCGNDAVVVSYHFGSGEVAWWSSARPLTNAGLKEDADLRLLLASLGPPRSHILFDEFIHGNHTTPWDFAGGIPLRSLLFQCGLVALLLLFSFSRRSGPIRDLIHLPRTSPLEFAESMGHLYRKAEATQIAADSARRRLLRYLHESCGIPADIIRSSPQNVASVLHQRFGGDWSGLEQHLVQAADSEFQPISPSTAFSLVTALNHDMLALKARVQPQPSPQPEGVSPLEHRD